MKDFLVCWKYKHINYMSLYYTSEEAIEKKNSLNLYNNL